MFGAGGTHSISYNIRLKPIEERSKQCGTYEDKERSSGFRDCRFLNRPANMGFGGNTIDVEIYGYNIAETNIVAEQLAEKIRKIQGQRCNYQPINQNRVADNI